MDDRIGTYTIEVDPSDSIDYKLGYHDARRGRQATPVFGSWVSRSAYIAGWAAGYETTRSTMPKTEAPVVAENEETFASLVARDAEERGQGICRTCLLPIWNEGGTVRHTWRAKGWSDRIKRGGDSLVCFKALDYSHVPLEGREADIYDRAIVRVPNEAYRPGVSPA